MDERIMAQPPGFIPDGFEPDVEPFNGPRLVSADEPDTYWAGALKGAKEGVLGGAKGFVEGLATSPKSLIEGIAHILTTNPLTTVGETVDALKRLPAAIRDAGVDPETWGRSVGNVTGQTMLTAAAPTGVSAAGRGLAAAGPAVKAATNTVARGVASAAQAVDPDLVGLLSPRAAHAMRVAARAGRVVDRATSSEPVAPSPMAPAEASLGPSVAPPLAVGPTAGPSVSAPVAPPADSLLSEGAVRERLALRNASRTGPPAGTAMSKLWAAMEQAGVRLPAQDMDTAARAIAQGQDAGEVVQAVMRLRNMSQPSAFAGLPSDAEVAARVAERNRTGVWPR